MICTHLDQIKEVKPSADGCEECLKTGDSWVHLRLVQNLRARWLLRLLAE